MQLPFFYIESFQPNEKIVKLNDENSRHIVQVLRMQPGDLLHLTDGKGTLLTAKIIDGHKRHCTAEIVDSSFSQPSEPKVTIAISLLKNSTRFEWFLEKATEIGVAEIVPLICLRTEKQKLRSDRMRGILTSAMMQSRQQWLPVFHEVQTFQHFISDERFKNVSAKFIAHCADEEKSALKFDNKSSVILIGPEGDFAATEIDVALKAGYAPVSLGETRLRTETAGLVAAVRLKLGN